MNWSRLSRLFRYFPLGAGLLILAALIMPSIERPSPVNHYLLVFDISQSMNVEDVALEGQSQSRFLASKQTARELIGTLPCGSRVGLAVFAATRTVTLLTPLDVCEHYNGLLTSLQSIDGRMRFKNASSVGKGVHQSLRAANAIGNNTAVVLFTDGHEAPPLRHGQTGMPKSEGHDIKGFIIGVGGDEPAPIPKVNNNGQAIGFWQADEVTQLPDDEKTTTSLNTGEERSSLREVHIKNLGQLSGLTYLRLEQVDTAIDQLIHTAFAVKETTRVNFSWIPATLALLLLILRFVPWHRLRTKP